METNILPPPIEQDPCARFVPLAQTSVDHSKTRQKATSLQDLTMVIFGASGDLAKRKIYPAIWSLYKDGLLPENLRVIGYARSSFVSQHFLFFSSDSFLLELTKEELIKNISAFIKVDKVEAKDDKKLVQGSQPKKVSDEEKLKNFYELLSYHAGSYDEDKDFESLNEEITKAELKVNSKVHHRFFFLSLPPNVFLSSATLIGKHCRTNKGWNRIIIEKPFGRDLESFEELSRGINDVFTQDEIYRIDHYIGKEIVQNLLALRFANVIFDPLWNRNNIKSIQIIFKEELGVEGRGGYFDHYGIIRDVMQNHLMQVLALVCMEQPVSLEPEDLRNEKVKVLKSISPVQKDEIVIGQYKGYTEDPTVPEDSITPTFAACALQIKNSRWVNVPILLKCGKGLGERLAEIRIVFNEVPASLYEKIKLYQNELVIRIQPNEAIYFKIMNKVPGLQERLIETQLDFTYKSKFSVANIPDAYCRLILETLEGNQGNFISEEELRVCWKIFTPILKYLEEQHIVPDKYTLGSRGPVESDYLAAKYNIKFE